MVLALAMVLSLVPSTALATDLVWNVNVTNGTREPNDGSSKKENPPPNPTRTQPLVFKDDVQVNFPPSEDKLKTEGWKWEKKDSFDWTQPISESNCAGILTLNALRLEAPPQILQP